jgi:hypothetical protein
MSTWSFKNFQVASEIDELKDIVLSFEWTCTEEQNDKVSAEQHSNHYVSSAFGVVYLNQAQRDNFILLENLTQDVVKNWFVDIFSASKISEIELQLKENIEQQKNQNIKTVLMDF